MVSFLSKHGRLKNQTVEGSWAILRERARKASMDDAPHPTERIEDFEQRVIDAERGCED